MNKRLAIMRTSNLTNEKEIIDIIHESIFDVELKHNNVYTMKKLIELERLIKGDYSISYQIKLIDDEELKAIAFNRELNDKPRIQGTAKFFIFLIEFARNLDEEYYHGNSSIMLNKYDYEKLNIWIKKTIEDINNKKNKAVK